MYSEIKTKVMIKVIKNCYDDLDDDDDDEVEMSLGTFGCLPDLSNRINYQLQLSDNTMQ